MMEDKIDYGDFAKSFEKRLKDRTGIKNIIAINSFFNALQLVLDVMEIKPGDEVIIPSFAPQIYLNVVLLKNAIPIIVDMEDKIFRPSLEAVKKSITDKTKAIILPYLFGYIYDIQPFIDLFPNIIEDITYTIGSEVNDNSPGKKGKFAIANFSSKGIITTGEGAAIFTNNRKDYNKVINKIEIGYDAEYFPRYDCLMPDLNAAMGVSQDESLKHRLKLRTKIGEFYEESVRKSHGTTLVHNEGENNNRVFSEFPAIFKSGLKNTIQYFKKNKVEVKKPFDFPLHQYLNKNKKDFPNTEFLYLKILLIPIYSSLLKKDVDLIAKIIASII
jgi:perosamine synthetase